MNRDAVVIVHPALNGQINMAVDEAMLANATPDWPIVLRIYQWTPATLSIGRFQDLPENSLSEWKSLPVVRRKTGGGAILHDHELTYSLLLPTTSELQLKGHSELLYRSVHIAFAERLQQLGWDARLSEDCTCSKIKKSTPEPFLCFLRRSPVDLLVGTHKILGSAQRRTNNGLLQHGSFLIRHSFWTPQILGLVDIPKSLVPAVPQEMASNFSYHYSGWTSRDEAPFWNQGLETVSAKEDLNSWVDFVVQCIQKGLEKVANCRWRTSGLEQVLKVVEPIAGGFA